MKLVTDACNYLRKTYEKSDETLARSMVQSLSYRGIGELITFVTAFAVTGKLGTAAKVSAYEVGIKIFANAAHNYGWSFVRWGRKPIQSNSREPKEGGLEVLSEQPVQPVQVVDKTTITT